MHGALEMFEMNLCFFHKFLMETPFISSLPLPFFYKVSERFRKISKVQIDSFYWEFSQVLFRSEE